MGIEYNLAFTKQYKFLNKVFSTDLTFDYQLRSFFFTSNLNPYSTFYKTEIQNDLISKPRIFYFLGAKINYKYNNATFCFKPYYVFINDLGKIQFNSLFISNLKEFKDVYGYGLDFNILISF